MDHFFGFDRLLRICLGRNTSLRFYGPPGFSAQVAHKLAAYTWNLVENYPGDLMVDVWEVDSGWQAGGIAREAGARLVIPFHFSPRYADRETQLRGEIKAAWGGFP